MKILSTLLFFTFVFSQNAFCQNDPEELSDSLKMAMGKVLIDMVGTKVSMTPPDSSFKHISFNLYLSEQHNANINATIMPMMYDTLVTNIKRKGPSDNGMEQFESSVLEINGRNVFYIERVMPKFEGEELKVIQQFFIPNGESTIIFSAILPFSKKEELDALILSSVRSVRSE